jgi:hypothetical protein
MADSQKGPLEDDKTTSVNKHPDTDRSPGRSEGAPKRRSTTLAYNPHTPSKLQWVAGKRLSRAFSGKHPSACGGRLCVGKRAENSAFCFEQPRAPRRMIESIRSSIPQDGFGAPDGYHVGSHVSSSSRVLGVLCVLDGSVLLNVPFFESPRTAKSAKEGWSNLSARQFLRMVFGLPGEYHAVTLALRSSLRSLRPWRFPLNRTLSGVSQFGGL